jgi:hypothetical protein
VQRVRHEPAGRQQLAFCFSSISPNEHPQVSI